ncbi:MAG: type II toxin-antitoxin system Phd/YefM family antitoxin [Erysipelotrichaceae bacterium]|nr:type II toxin-antitoxin system Phd/YefM family antitoxin [Erysipelotrichaceae bacterium]
MSIRKILNGTVPISWFNQGKAGKIFGAVRKEGPKVVIKNNVPECVLMSPEEYLRFADEIEEARLLKMAVQRLAKFDPNETIPASEVYARFNISQDEINAMDEVEFE